MTEATEQMVNDLNSIVMYLQVKYHTEKIVLLGRLRGSMLGIMYALRDLEKVLVYIVAGHNFMYEKPDEFTRDFYAVLETM